MSELDLSERLQDLAGPIVVKEVRQGLRSNAFVVFFTLLLVACLFMALLAVALPESTRLGQQFFTAYLIALGTVCYFVIPYSAFRSIAKEREEETWVLLALTGLSPVSVVRGKFGSAMAQAMLYASACAPFVLLTYYLNGVSITQVLAALIMSWTWTFLLVAFAVSMGTMGDTRMGRGLAHSGVLGALGLASAIAFGFTAALSFELGAESGRLEFWGAVLAMAVLSLGAGMVMMEGAAASLALPTEAGLARRPRLAVAGYAVLMLAMGELGHVLGMHSHDLVVGGTMANLALTVAGLFFISEADGYPRSAGPRGFLRPGAFRGYSLLVLLIGGSTAAWLMVSDVRHGFDRDLRLTVAFAAYLLLYLSLAAVVGRLLPVGRSTRPAVIRATFVVLVGLASAAPPMLSSAFGHNAENRTWNVLNPVIGLSNLGRSYTNEYLLLTVLGAAAVAMLLAFVFLRVRDSERRT